jgi:Protein of unknown function (DUF3631)
VAVGGAELLDDVCAALRWWVKFPCPEAADAAVLYIAATYAAGSLQFAPRLRVKSPQKRCGKTRFLEVSSWLAYNPLKTANISAAALVRSIGDDPPTIIFDEADAVFGKGLKGDEKAEHLRGILNAGFDRNQPYTRWDVTTRSLEICETFALAIIAGIGDLPDTIEDRSVPLILARKTKDESCTVIGPHGPCQLVHKFRPRRDVGYLLGLRERLAAWVLPRADQIGAAEPGMPDGLNDRAEDVWEALIAVADLAGGLWPERARAAAVKLMADAETDGADRSLGLRLLADLRDIFAGSGGAAWLPTSDLVAGLCRVEESPWRTINHGNPIDANRLAMLLRPWDVRPQQIKTPPNTVTRGYYADSFRQVWARYLPQDQAGYPATPATGVTPQVNPVAGPNPVAGQPATYYQTQASDLGGSGVAGVADDRSRTGHQDLISEQAGNLGPPGHDFAQLYRLAIHTLPPDADDDSDWQA